MRKRRVCSRVRVSWSGMLLEGVEGVCPGRWALSGLVGNGVSSTLIVGKVQIKSRAAQASWGNRDDVDRTIAVQKREREREGARWAR